MNQKAGTFDVRQIFLILKKHVWMILILTILFGGADYYISRYMLISQYQSDAVLVVKPDADPQSSTVTYEQITMAQQLVGTYSVILKSDNMMNRVIKDLNLPMTSSALADHITVNGESQNEVIDLTVTDTSPQRAAAIANDLVQAAPEIISQAFGAGSIEVVSAAKVNSSPVTPNVKLNVTVALLCGALLSMIAAFAMEMMNHTITSNDDVQKYLGTSVLGIIPNLETK